MRIGRWSRLTGTVALTAAVTVLGLKIAGADFSPLSGDPSYQQFLQVYHTLQNSYVEPISTQRLMVGATQGIVNAVGDPYSMYMDPQTAARWRELVTSRFQGIGAVLSGQGSKMLIQSILPGSPAQKAGLEPGDELTAVNGTSTAKLSLEQAVMLIRGPVGTRVTLSVVHGGKPVTLTMLRAPLEQRTVSARMIKGDIGYLLITQFSEDTAALFDADLQALVRHGARGLIIDVRQDPGGLLQSVAKISDALLPRNAVIVQIAGRDGQRQVIRATGTALQLPIVCLIDGNSASAAEILAAALHDSAHVPLIGERSFGKGTVQETQDFPDGTILKLTVARWLTPDGTWIHRKGIRPDIAVPTPVFYRLPPLPVPLMKPLVVNDNSVWIAVLQRMLLALGFEPGRTDGYFNTQTEQAVMAYQRLHQLPATGRVDDATAYAISGGILSLKQKDDPQLTAAIGYLEGKLQQ